MYFLALSQAPPALDMKIAMRTPVTREPASSAAESLCAKENTYDNRSYNCHDTRNKHFLKSCVCRYGYACLVVRICLTFKKAWDCTELTAYFFDHLVCCLGNRLHCKCREEERKHTTYKEADCNVGIEDVNTDIVDANSLSIRYKQSQSCEGCGTDSETFTHSSGCVTDSVQLICDFTNRIIKAAHFSNTTGVVGDRTVSVNSNGDACCGEHTYGCKSDTIKARNLE